MTDPQSLAIATELETQRAWALTRAAQAAGQIGALTAEVERLKGELAKPPAVTGYPCKEGAVIIEDDGDGFIVDIAGGIGITRCADWTELMACIRPLLTRPTQEDGA